MRKIVILALTIYSLASIRAFAKPEKGDELEVAIAKLHPTQFSMGDLEVERKQSKISKMKAKELAEYKVKKIVPVIIGPKGEYYLVDHHHTTRALEIEGHENVQVRVLENYSDMSEENFWNAMIEHNWVYLYDENGKGPLDPRNLPKKLSELKDDPYRSLAGRTQPGSDVDAAERPYKEFAWAQYFRSKGLLDDYMKETREHKKEELYAEAVEAAVKMRKVMGHATCRGLLDTFYATLNK